MLLQGLYMINIPITDQFSVHWYAWKLIDFYSLSNFDTGWVWFHISVAFSSIHYKPQKGILMMVTPSSWQVSAFLNMVHPVGVIWIIFHNFVSPHWIPTKIDTNIEPFMCAQFQFNCLCFYDQKCKVCKINKKLTRNKNEILLTQILGMAGAICFKFGM